MPATVRPRMLPMLSLGRKSPLRPSLLSASGVQVQSWVAVSFSQPVEGVHRRAEITFGLLALPCPAFAMAVAGLAGAKAGRGFGTGAVVSVVSC
eukprot:5294636-Pleurochrysis_carterae.AAC.3